MLRRADVELGKGKKVPEVCKRLGITRQTYYRWRQKYGGMAPEMAKELKALQKENTRLKKLVADQTLDNAILKEAAKGNWQALNGVGKQLLRSVVVWGQRKYRSVDPIVWWANLAARSENSCVRHRAKRKDHVWSYDFLSARTTDGR